MSGWCVRWTTGRTNWSKPCESYEAALNLKDWLEANGAASVTIEEEEPNGPA